MKQTTTTWASTAKRTVCAAAITLFATACGGGGAEPDVGVASLADSTTPSSDPSTSEADGVDAGLEAPDNPEDAFALYDECMSDHGIEFETVGPGSGGITVEEADGLESAGGTETGTVSLGDFDFDDFQTADEACRGHLASVDAGFDMTPEQEAAFEDAQLAFQDCMRDHGVDVPDIGGAGGIVIEAGPTDADPQQGATFSDATFDFEAFEQAAGECDDVFSELDAQFGEGDR